MPIRVTCPKEIPEMLIACLLVVLPATRRKVGRRRCHEPIPVVFEDDLFRRRPGVSHTWKQDDCKKLMLVYKVRSKIRA